METLKNCIICKKEAEEKFLTCIDDTVTKELFSLKKCSSCGFVYTNPRPKADLLYKYYESEDYVSHSNTDKGIINKIYQRVRKITLKQKLKLINSLVKKGTIMDIGCGTGEFLYTCNKDGWKTIGIEPSEKGREQAVKNYKLDVFEEKNINNISENSIDIITMWHVLEHVPLIHERITEISKLLKEKGILIVAVPNRESLDAKIYKENWAGYDVPRHLYHFRKKDIDKLFDPYGFKIIKTKPMLFDAFYVSMLSEKIKTGKSNFLKGMLIGSISNLYAIFNKNSFSSQIYILSKKNPI